MSITTFAQNFEDVLLWRVLGSVPKGTYIDIGAQDPVIDSVSLAFYQAGWRGMHVEATPNYAEALRRARPDEVVIEAAITDAAGPVTFYQIEGTGLSTGVLDIALRHEQAGWTYKTIIAPSMRLEELFDLADMPVNWLKIDVEGMEANVLRSWGDHPARPWVVVIEATAPNSQELTDHLWRSELERRGYKEAYFDGLSRYFVHDEHRALRVKLTAGANIFDGYQITDRHFSVQQLTRGWEERGASAQHEREMLEQQIADAQTRLITSDVELAKARDALSGLKANSELLQQSLEVAQQRFETAQAELARIRDELVKATESIGAARKEHVQSIERAWQERHAFEILLRRDFKEIEASLRADLAEGDARLSSALVDLALLRERSKSQAGELEALRQKATSDEQRIARQSAELEQHKREREDDDRRLRAAEADREQAQAALDRTERESRTIQMTLDDTRLEMLRTSQAFAELRQLTSTILQSRLSTWRRLGTALGWFGGDDAYRRLAQWLFANVEVTPDGRSAEHKVALEDRRAEDCGLAMYDFDENDKDGPSRPADTLRQLLEWDDVHFVRCAYATILGRQADRDGERHFTRRLRRGISKMDVLSDLRRSKEGRSAEMSISELDRELAKAARARMPLLGRLMPDSRLEPQRKSDAPLRAISNRLARLDEKMNSVVRQVAEREVVKAIEPLDPKLGPVPTSLAPQARSHYVTIEDILSDFG